MGSVSIYCCIFWILFHSPIQVEQKTSRLKHHHHHMSNYNKAQLEALWAGENPGLGNPRLMAAIALAESSGNEGVVNSVGACGLWQIHPFEQGCKDARTNARMAGAKLRGQGLTAWETYTNGSYRQFYTAPKAGEMGAGATLPISFAKPLSQYPGKTKQEKEKERDKAAEKEAGEGVIEHEAKITPSVNPFEVFKSLSEFFTLLITPAGWVRIGKILIGGTIILVGIIELGKIGAGSEAKPIPSKVAKGVGAAATAAALEPIK